MACRNSGVISRNSGVISRNSGAIFWTESSAGFDCSKKSFDRNHEFCYFLGGGRPEASIKETWRATHFVTKNFRDTVAEKEGFLATYSLVSSWKSLLGHELLTFCDGPALRPFGRWARAMGTGRLQCWAVE